METRMSIWGVGPRIMVPTFAYLALAAIATYLWPTVCFVPGVPRGLFLVAGAVHLAIGIPMLVIAVRTVSKAYKDDSLATTGIFGIVRNPIYSAWIVFNIPGLALLIGSWPAFFAPFIAYYIFKLLILKEEVYLQQRSGQTYVEYKARVPQLFPWTWMRDRRK